MLFFKKKVLYVIAILYTESDYILLLQILEQKNVEKQFLMLNTALGQALDKPISIEISDEVREQVTSNS